MSKPVFDGDYGNFPEVWRALQDTMDGSAIKYKKIQQNGEISMKGLFLFGKMSTCPAKDDNSWTMDEICNQNDLDRPGPDNDAIRRQLLEFEAEVFENQDERDVTQLFSISFKQDIAPFFDRNLPEILNMDSNDPYRVIRFLQTVYTNYLKYVELNQSTILATVMDKCREWKGGSAQQFKAHTQQIQKLIAELPQPLRRSFDSQLAINFLVESLGKDTNIQALHTIIRTKFMENRASVTFSYIEQMVTAVLKDIKPETTISHDDPVAATAVASFYTQKKRRNINPRNSSGKLSSPIVKRATSSSVQVSQRNLIPRLSPTKFQNLSDEERTLFIKARRLFNAQSSDNKASRRGRGGASKQGQNKSEAEADIAELTSGGVSCFNAEISQELSNMSTMETPNDPESVDPVADDTATDKNSSELKTDSTSTNSGKDSSDPKIESSVDPVADDTAADKNSSEPEPKTDSTSGQDSSDPKIESSPMDAMPPPSSSWLQYFFILGILGAMISFGIQCCCDIFTSLLKFVRYAWVELISFLSAIFQATKSATSCSAEQYKPYLRYQGSYTEFCIITGLIFLIVAVILQSFGAQAAEIRTRPHLNANQSLLTSNSISPLMSFQAAESMLNYKNGSWLFSYQVSDLEAHVATLPSADHNVSLDWILDSGASCHFCNDSSKFITMKKCNISISTAKKGESLLAIGIGTCQITTQNANGDLVNLICHDTLYVPEARRNLLSASKLAKDRFQVVLPAPDSVFPPGIYNCRKNKTSVAHSIPIVAIGSLFHVQTCSDAEIRRSDRVENKWVCWHKRLGYMPFDVLQHMIHSCQGLDDLQGVSMPRN